MAIDGHRSNLSPEAASYLTRVENRLLKIESQISSAISSLSYLTTQSRVTSQRAIPGVPYAQASGTIVLPSTLANGASTNQTITFPTGRFTVTPNISLSTNSTRLGAQADNRTQSGFRFLVSNFSGASAGAGAGDTTLIGFWTAIQMTEDSASG